MGHDVTDRMSLEIARRVVVRLQENPATLQIALDNLERWSARNAQSPSLLRCYAEWREILRRPIPEICQVLLSEDDEGQRLRQNSPFPGVISPQELWDLKKHFRHATPGT